MLTSAEHRRRGARLQQLRDRRPRVMVSCEKILKTAREVNADIIGLSGLITPRWMRWCVAGQRDGAPGFPLPLLIGGATTSQGPHRGQDEQNFSDPVVYVPDASRAVGVAQSLLSPGSSRLRGRIDKVQGARPARQQAAAFQPVVWPRPPMVSAISWTGWAAPPGAPSPACRPSGTCPSRCCALHRLDAVLPDRLGPGGQVPRILEDAVVGRRPRASYADANAMLDQLEKDQSVRCAGIFGLFPANAVGTASRFTPPTDPRARCAGAGMPCASKRSRASPATVWRTMWRR